MNAIQLTKEYYNKFPTILKDALKNKKVVFPNSLQYKYEQLHVFRGVKYTKTKTAIDKSDFFSHIERNNPMIVADDNNISSYSCSFFMNIEAIHQ